MKIHFFYKHQITKTLSTFLILFFLFCMISKPALYIQKSLDGLSAWAFNVLPSVLPFMFFTRLLSSLNQMPRLVQPFSKLSKILFKTPPISIYAFVMAILSGYPVGSKMVADLFMQGKITKNDALKMSAFCSTSGPMFIVGAVGIGMFKSAVVGQILFASHVISAVLNGIVFGKILREKKEKQFSKISTTTNLKEKQSTPNLSDIVLDSTLAILSVGCIITIFFIVIEALSPIFNFLPQNLASFAIGLIEITKGCLNIATLPNKFLALTATSFVISFGGISTLLQSLTMLEKVKIPITLFVCQKFFHALLSAAITLILLCLFRI